MSIFTPQRGANNPECLTTDERRSVVEILRGLRSKHPKLDMPEGMINEFLTPPSSPDHCIFAQTTHTLSADFKTRVEPCQFGGDPDCSRCGCMASMGLAAVGNRKLVGSLTAGQIFWASTAIGRQVVRAENALRNLVTQDHAGNNRSTAPAEDLLKVLD